MDSLPEHLFRCEWDPLNGQLTIEGEIEALSVKE